MKRLRCAAGLTQESAAERAGVDRRYWQKLEAGESNASLDMITRVSNALGVSPADLLAPARRRR